MKRGEIWTVAGGPNYTSKSRPAVILHADRYADLDSIVIGLFTADDTHAPFVRIPVLPPIHRGLRSHCWLMIDKIATVLCTRLGARIGVLNPATLAAIVFLHLDSDLINPGRSH